MVTNKVLSVHVATYEQKVPNLSVGEYIVVHEISDAEFAGTAVGEGDADGLCLDGAASGRSRRARDFDSHYNRCRHNVGIDKKEVLHCR